MIKGAHKIEPVKYLIKVQLNRSQREISKKVSNARWIELLGDSTTDWAAILLLYDLYEKDAIHFSNNIRNRSEWLIKNREADIEYWTAKLK